MSSILLTFVTVFALVLVAELPDKTLLATVVLTTRFRPSAVLTAASGAFAIQVVLAVMFGGVLTLLPDPLVTALVGGMFAAGAFLLLRGGFRSRDDASPDAASWSSTPASFRRGVLTSFGMLFAAEWGDASQLATAAMAAHYGQPLAVGLGAFLAALCVAGLAAFLGQALRKRIRPRLIQRAAGFVLASLAALTFSTMLV